MGVTALLATCMPSSEKKLRKIKRQYRTRVKLTIGGPDNGPCINNKIENFVYFEECKEYMLRPHIHLELTPNPLPLQLDLGATNE